MKEKILKNKTIVIVVAAIVIAGIGFAAGSIVKSSLAKEDGNYISAEKAKAIALENVGVSPSKATFVKVDLDKNDAPATYEIEFYTYSNKYDFEIHGSTGAIIEKSSEAIPQVPSQNTDGASAADNNTPTDYIGISKAKSIALKHAGISSNHATIVKAKLDSDDGVKTYEINFIAGDKEYDYEINAITGAIIDYDMEAVHDEGD